MRGTVFWGQASRMSWTFFLPDLLREFRAWSYPASSCPWGAVGLGLLVFWIAGCCCGALLSALVFSLQCRRLVHLALRLAAQWSGGTAETTAVAARLREYNRHL